MGRLIDETGKKYGRLTVIRRATLGKNYKLLCLCECGKETEVSVPSLRSGYTKSCGCLKKETATINSTKHGGHGSTEYRTWQAMIRRCTDKNHKNYTDYGGRGIAVCNRWLEGYSNFLEDMGIRPTKDHSIERIDNNGNYEKDNCKWETKINQGRNRRVKRTNEFGVSGISLNKNRDKYTASIFVNKKWIRLGTFISLTDAINARKNGELKYWGKSS